MLLDVHGRTTTLEEMRFAFRLTALRRRWRLFDYLSQGSILFSSISIRYLAYPLSVPQSIKHEARLWIDKMHIGILFFFYLRMVFDLVASSKRDRCKLLPSLSQPNLTVFQDICMACLGAC